MDRGQAQDVTTAEKGVGFVSSLSPPPSLGGWGTVEIDAYMDVAKQECLSRALLQDESKSAEWVIANFRRPKALLWAGSGYTGWSVGDTG